MPVELRSDLSPSMAMQRARDLLAPVLPKHENVVEAERILIAAQRQHDLANQRAMHERVDPFGRARLLLDEAFGLGVQAVHQHLETDATAKAIYDSAINAIARLLERPR